MIADISDPAYQLELEFSAGMSLGQRINGNLDKSADLSQNERERYESQIRLLKVLSKSQTSFLKVYRTQLVDKYHL
ncbi:hypothetical protein EON65_55940 [archaeon]|nr:MAG: hypothetical protein EON65_55940 [archaeon]